MSDYYTAAELQEKTGTPAATYRWWAYMEMGPPSIKIGRRRVWKKSVIDAWLVSLESDGLKSVASGHLRD